MTLDLEPQSLFLGDSIPRPKFNDQPEQVVIDPLERDLGLKSRAYYEKTLRRGPLWLIKNNKVRPSVADIKAGMPQVITGDDLAKTPISDELASVLFTFKRVEDKLADFSGSSYGFFRNIWGINLSYHQWSFEEAQHSSALGLILEATGHKTPDQITDDYYDNLQQTWVPPFPTARMMVLYAAMQEIVTRDAYAGLKARAREEDAPLVGLLLEKIQEDEAYHGGGYRKFSQMYADQDLDGTVADAVHVATEFRMPAQNLMLDPKRETFAAVKMGAFGKEMQRGALVEVLDSFKFVPENMIPSKLRQARKK